MPAGSHEASRDAAERSRDDEGVQPFEDDGAERPPAESGDDDALGAPVAADAENELAPLTIEMSAEDLFVTSGAVLRLDTAALRRAGHDDPAALVSLAPGVFARTEDGFGLRPNIGLRGASSERSRKITLLEDGVPFAPAPYAAPAAYYFPLMARVVGIDVYKGPAAILFGPHTVGGAVDLRTRDVPASNGGQLEAALGLHGYARLHAHHGGRLGPFGWLGEIVHLRSDGFKHIDGSDNSTGFARTEGVLRLRLESDPDAFVAQRVEARGTISYEVSDETYLGLTDADFRADPYRRYAASALDRMRWRRGALRLDHQAWIGDGLEMATVGYLHLFSRVWRRLQRVGRHSIAEVLAAPTGARQLVYDLLRGEVDSTRLGEEDVIYLARNGRDYVSTGVQSEARLRLRTGPLEHDVRAGLRLHHDRADYDQTEHGYWMDHGVLVPTGRPASRYSWVSRRAEAIAAHVGWGLRLGGLRLAPGLRVEHVVGHAHDRLRARNDRLEQLAVLPALGATVAITDDVVALAGVHRGFSPLAPGEPGASPELAVSYELGARWRQPADEGLVELVGHFTDYSNLSGTCSFASGCLEADRQFDGGRVFVWGAELAATRRIPLGPVQVPLRVVYTYTGSRFRSSFESSNPQYGRVREGDELPYVPAHQLGASIGVERDRLGGLSVMASWVDAMREQAGQGPAGPWTDAHALVDVTGWWQASDRMAVTLRAENVTFERALASRRPFGARPVRPFQLQLGVRVPL